MTQRLNTAHDTTQPVKAVVPKLFLIAYHLWEPHCHHVPPCSRKTQSTKYHSIKSLENQNWHICQGCHAVAPELGILLGAGARIKNQEPELSLKFRAGAGDMAFERWLRVPS